MQQAMNHVQVLLTGKLTGRIGKVTNTLLVVGAPKSGKTTLAMRAFQEAASVCGVDHTVMAVSGRVMADALSGSIMRDLKVSGQARPVTTLSALAFRIITRLRARRNDLLPKLLNGAEQDAVLRAVLAQHIVHAHNGDWCDTCGLLARYFADANWASVVVDDALIDKSADANTAKQELPTDELFERGINDALINQLRDTLARMNELGIEPSQESEVIQCLQEVPQSRGERLAAQWRLAFALWREYSQAIVERYPNEFRLDASCLLVEGRSAVAQCESSDLPSAVVVDDVHDVTLAGMAFLQALEQRGCRLVLTGNPDEAVQGFRGSYPELLLLRMVEPPTNIDQCGINNADLGCLNAHLVDLDAERCQQEPHTAPTYLDLVESRISLGILSTESHPLPVEQRPGKLVRFQHAMPITPLDENDPLLKDGTVQTALYHSADEEFDDVIWGVKRAHFTRERQWNDMAIIAHDNATVRAYGERLRREGIPVRYSSVTRPLKDESFVQGLFAMIELAQLRLDAARQKGIAPRMLAALVRRHVTVLMNSTLVGVRLSSGEIRPVRMAAIHTAMRALESLSTVLMNESSMAPLPLETQDKHTDADTDGKANANHGERTAALRHLTVFWRQWLDAFPTDSSPKDALRVDDSLMDGQGAADNEAEMPFGIDAMYVMLATDSAAAKQVLESIHAVCGTHGRGDDADAEAFAKMWEQIGQLAASWERLPDDESQYVLWEAWQAAHVAELWQQQALKNNDEGRAANDRLDAAMRLFQFSESTGAKRHIADFIAQVREMRIEADSLAQVKPLEQAVTLTTPAGSAGGSWKEVWLPALQQGVWPNLAARDTLFAVEDLANIVLHGHLDPWNTSAVSSVLYAEKKSLLVAMTRSEERVHVSAVMTDDTAPSDFLYGFFPERYRHGEEQFRTVGETGGYRVQEYSVRGIVTASRSILAARMATELQSNNDAQGNENTHIEPVEVRQQQETASNDIVDAAQTLAYLSAQGVAEADPANWPFLYWHEDVVAAESQQKEPSQHPAVTLSPSAVDRIWECPVCWMLENRCAGPQAGSVSTSFGTIIHAVAEHTTAQGWDLPSYADDLPHDQRVKRITDQMMQVYRSMRIDPNSIEGAEQRYQALRKDRQAQTMLSNMATYYVSSNEPGYAQSKSVSFAVGNVERVEGERQFVARFGLGDILKAYNAIEDRAPVKAQECYAMLGLLAGGWPEGMSPDISIRLSGRIDRLEHRRMDDGSIQIRLIDYKTGKDRGGAHCFNDLQLVCYQLGLAFPEHGDASKRAMATIGHSGLFYVADRQFPAFSRGAECAYQPPLFEHGHLNTQPFQIRNGWVKSLDKFFQAPDLPSSCPAELSEQAWERLLSERNTQTGWAMTMIARVLYAAGVMRSARIEAHPTNEHLKFCRFKGSCPACAGETSSIMEVQP